MVLPPKMPAQSSAFCSSASSQDRKSRGITHNIDFILMNDPILIKVIKGSVLNLYTFRYHRYFFILECVIDH